VIVTILTILGIWTLLFIAFIGLWLVVHREARRTGERMRQLREEAQRYREARRC
jgi:hypothetical protein